MGNLWHLSAFLKMHNQTISGTHYVSRLVLASCRLARPLRDFLPPARIRLLLVLDRTRGSAHVHPLV